MSSTSREFLYQAVCGDERSNEDTSESEGEDEHGTLRSTSALRLIFPLGHNDLLGRYLPGPGEAGYKTPVLPDEHNGQPLFGRWQPLSSVHHIFSERSASFLFRSGFWYEESDRGGMWRRRRPTPPGTVRFVPKWFRPYLLGAVFIVYLLAPVYLVIGRLSTCEDGAPSVAYPIMLAGVVYISALDYGIVEMAGHLDPQWSPNDVRSSQGGNVDPIVLGREGMFYQGDSAFSKEALVIDSWKGNCMHAAFNALMSKPVELGPAIMDLPEVLFLLSKLETLDVYTDFLLPGQMAACEEEHEDDVALYQKSWQAVPIIGSMMQYVRFSAVLYVFLFLAYYSQLAGLLRNVCNLWIPSTGDRQMVGAAKIAEATGAGASGCLLALYDVEVQAELTRGEDGSDCGQEFTPALEAAETAGNVLLSSIWLRVVLEAAPSLWNAATAASLMWARAGTLTKVKIGLSWCLSLITILIKVKKLVTLGMTPLRVHGSPSHADEMTTKDLCLAEHIFVSTKYDDLKWHKLEERHKLEEWHTDRKGIVWGRPHPYRFRMLGIALCLIVLVISSSIKAAGVFVCDSSVLSLAAAACVPKQQ